MRCILMNKNTKVLEAEYNKKIASFTNIYNIENIDYAPIIIKNALKENNNNITILTEWFKGRGIPSWRDDLDLLLAKLNITTREELLDKAFGLSLSDQYWIKPYNSNVQYKDINFFEHDFNSADFINITCLLYTSPEPTRPY